MIARHPTRPSLAATAALALVAGAAMAQEARDASEFNRPFGLGPGEENEPFDARTRDGDGNRLIVNGRIIEGSSQFESATLGSTITTVGAGSNSATAIGNSLSVVTQGSYNTVIVDATQINNGDQEANLVLNGSLDLD